MNYILDVALNSHYTGCEPFLTILLDQYDLYWFLESTGWSNRVKHKVLLILHAEEACHLCCHEPAAEFHPMAKRLFGQDGIGWAIEGVPCDRSTCTGQHIVFAEHVSVSFKRDMESWQGHGESAPSAHQRLQGNGVGVGLGVNESIAEYKVDRG